MSDDSDQDKKLRRYDRVLYGLVAAVLVFVGGSMWLIVQMFERPKHDSAAAARQFEAFHQQFPHVRHMRESDLVGRSLEGAAAPPPRGTIAVRFPSMRADHHGKMLAIRYCIQDGGCGLATTNTGNNEVGFLRAPDGMRMTAYALSRDGASLFAAITCGTSCNPPYEPNFIVEVDVATRRIVWAKPLHRLYVADLVVDESKSQFVMATATSSYDQTFGASTGFQKLVAFQRKSGTGEELREVETLAPKSNSYLFSGYEGLHWCADGRVVAVARLVGARVTSADLMREAGADESWAIHNRTWGGQFGLIVEVSSGYGARVIPSMSKLAGLDSWNGVAFVVADGQCREFVARLARLNGPPLIFRMDRTSVREADMLAQSIRAVSSDGGAVFGARTMAAERTPGGRSDPFEIVRIDSSSGEMTVIPVRGVIEREVMKLRDGAGLHRRADSGSHPSR